MVNAGLLPTKNVVCHGFVVDDQGKKFSKSSGNGFSLEQAVEKYNADCVRLWVVCSDFTKDVNLSWKQLESAAQDYKKLRGCFRFMLQNLADFDCRTESVEFGKLNELEQFMLLSLEELQRQYFDSFGKFDLTSVSSSLLNFCRTKLSAFYFEMAKPRLYFEQSNCPARKQVQTVLYQMMNHLVMMFAPLTSFLCEEVWLHFNKTAGRQHKKWPQSVFLQTFVAMDSVVSKFDERAKESWNSLLKLKQVGDFFFVTEC